MFVCTKSQKGNLQYCDSEKEKETTLNNDLHSALQGLKVTQLSSKKQSPAFCQKKD